MDTGLDLVKIAFKKVVHKAGEFLGNNIVDAVTSNAIDASNNDKIVKPDENTRNVEEMIIPPEKRKQILKKLRQLF